MPNDFRGRSQKGKKKFMSGWSGEMKEKQMIEEMARISYMMELRLKVKKWDEPSIRACKEAQQPVLPHSWWNVLKWKPYRHVQALCRDSFVILLKCFKYRGLINDFRIRIHDEWCNLMMQNGDLKIKVTTEPLKYIATLHRGFAIHRGSFGKLKNGSLPVLGN